MKRLLLCLFLFTTLPFAFSTTLQLYPSNVTMKPNTSLRFTIIATDADGTMYTPQNVKWQTYPGSIYDGTYTSPNQSGYYTVTAKWNGQKASASITVKQAYPSVSRIVIDPYSTTVAINKYYQFKAVAYDSYGRVVEFNAKWWTDGGSISNTGYYQAGYNTGNYTVWVQDVNSGMKASASVNVIREVNPNPSHGISKIVITPRNKQVYVNSYLQFEAYAYDQYGRQVNFNPVWWVDSGAGSISDKGYFQAGYNPGYYNVWVKDSYSGVKISTNVEIVRQVVNNPPTSDVRIDVLHWDIDQDGIFHRPHAKVKFKAYGYSVQKASLYGIYSNQKSVELESTSCSNEQEVYFRTKFASDIYWLEIRLYDSYDNVIARYKARAK